VWCGAGLAILVSLSLRVFECITGMSSLSTTTNRFSLRAGGAGMSMLRLEQTGAMVTVVLTVLRTVLSECVTSGDILPFAQSLLPSLSSLSRFVGFVCWPFECSFISFWISVLDGL
jgi:hypothetical protein